MRNIILTCLLLACGYAVNAQFSIQPQFGIENSRTAININEQSFVPAGVQFFPKLALRLDYKLNKSNGVYAGISTSAPAIDFTFSDPQSAATSYNLSRNNIEFRFEGGYQFSTKPIYFSKPGRSVSTHSFSRSFHQYGNRQQSCRTKSSCIRSSSANRCSKNANKTMAKNKGSYMKILPSLGFSYSPNQSSGIENKQGVYNYKGGAWNTALVAGTGFEFGNNRQAKFIVNINYLRGLGNMDTEMMNSVSNGKTVPTSFSSKASSWSISLGVPFSLSKRKKEVQHQYFRTFEKRQCGQSQKSPYRSRCGR